MRLIILAILMLWGIVGYGNQEKQVTEVSFKIEYKGIITSFNIVPLFVPENLENKITEIKIIDNEQEKFSLIEDNEETMLYKNHFYIESGKQKYRVVKIKKISTDEIMEIRVFEKTWFGSLKDGHVNGYSIGKYPLLQEDDKEKLGFIEVNKENINTKISPHFTLGEFRSKPLTAKLPVYIMLDERIIFKIEKMLSIFQKKYYYIEKFEIMSAYRTPLHNGKLRNVKKSRHIFGDAVDIFVDEDNNGKMDDLNKDGVIDPKDLKMLFDIADEMDNSSDYGYLKGGLSMYEFNAVVGEFLHIDARGFKIRW